MSSEVINLNAVEKWFDSAQALAGIDLTIRRGEFVALLGPSGCGKTTLLRLIAGFEFPTSGTVTVGGHQMTALPPNKRPVNTVFQNYALFPHMRVFDNVAFGLRRKRIPKTEVEKRTRSILELVGMQDFTGRFPHELSGGQQQRIALARAVVNEPEVLLLDEPLAALDRKLRKRMQVELKRLHETLGMTFVFVTHDQEEALAMADRIAVMNDGRVVQMGTGKEIYRAPASRYVADFIGEANMLSCKPVDGGCALADDTRLPYTVETASDARATVMIRPEDIRLCRDAESDSGMHTVTLRCTIRDKIFLGSTYRVFATLGSGEEISIEGSASDIVERISSGEEVNIQWPTAAGRVLTD